MQFLNPIWLFGISGILIPIIIHLWNIKSGKVLKVGSIMLMGESSRENSRSLKLQDYLLLLLRCLIIIVLSLLLAEPVLKLQKAEPAKGWILISRPDLKQAYENYKPEIDSLIAAEYEFRFFEPGFPKEDLANFLDDLPDSIAPNELSFWSLTRELKEISPTGLPINIYSNRLMVNFGGSRTLIPKQITWKTFAPDLHQQTRISAAWMTNRDSIAVFLANSDTSITNYKLIKISPEEKHPDFDLRVVNGQPAVSLISTQKEYKTEPVTIDTSSIRIGIYSDNYPEDLRYIKAALSALREFTSRRIVINDLTAVDPVNTFDLIFWLSEKAIPSSLSTKEAKLFAYATGKSENVNSQLLYSDLPISGKGGPIQLFKRISFENKSRGFSTWKDASGKPVLDRTTKIGQTTYRFYSRFNPDWTDLVWSAQFPEMLLPFILEEKSSEVSLTSDIRTIDQQVLQFSSATTSEKPAKSATTTHFTKIADWILLFMLSLIGIERWIAHRKQNARYGV